MITDLSVSNHRHSMALREAQLKLMMRQGGGGKGNPKGAPELWFYCVAAAAGRSLPRLPSLRGLRKETHSCPFSSCSNLVKVSKHQFILRDMLPFTYIII